MTVWVLVLVFVMGGQVQMKTTEYPTVEACVWQGNAVVAAQESDPLFGPGLFADCVPIKRIEA
jgi:hypothetical protein